ncbi:MAG: helix-turn-helix domain-containing protein [Acidovorax sp.]|jgi:AraC family transcriptional activator FtrA|nr:helix-turn-helix domain-containing protein [Acidovorax sp.]
MRRFTEATGQTPAQWLIAERVAEAQRLLEGSTLSVEHIAHAVGFASMQTLRHHFQAQLQLAPRDYRRMFAAPSSAASVSR